jgi:hypothetical protein
LRERGRYRKVSVEREQPRPEPKSYRIRDDFKESRAPILENFSDLSRIMRENNSEVAISGIWANLFEAMRFTYEAQGVIAARLMLFASAAPNAAEEAERMVFEKLVAFTDARLAAEQALSSGLGIYIAAERAYAPLRQCVHANSGRLHPLR